MKTKLTLSLLFIALFVSGNSASACSPNPDVSYPTINTVLSQNGVITLGRSLADGRVVAVERIQSSADQSPSYYLMQAPGHSCSERFGDFKQGEYVVSVTPEEVVMLSNAEFDTEFTFYFDTLSAAQAKYDELTSNEPTIQPIGSYIPAGYTLRSGMNNNDVRNLQQALNTVMRINLVLDGDYGRGTRSAVTNFQNQYGLVSDGIAGIMTQNQLSKISVSRPITESNGLDEFGRIVAPQCKIASFCNGPIECVNADLDTDNMAGTCEYRERYACYKNAGNICETQSTGNCGWTQTDALQMCIADADLAQETE